MSGTPKAGAKWSKFTVEGDKLVVKGETCPECGPGVFLAIHKNRKSCGRCGYTEMIE